MQSFANITSQNSNSNLNQFIIQPKDFNNAQDNVNNSEIMVDDKCKVLPTFLSTFINQGFLTNLINVLLYQSDFSNSASSVKSSDIIKYINKFLVDVSKQIKRSPNNTFPVSKNVLISSTNLAKDVLQLRENVTGRLINYDNVDQHFPKRDLVVSKILGDVSKNRLQNQDSFRKSLDDTLQSIQAFNEVVEISTTLFNWDMFLSEANKDNSSTFKLLKSYRDLISKSYNDLSQLTILHKQEELDDYIVLHDKQSIAKVVNNLVSFLSSGYNFFKTGYDLIDNNVDGMESATFHLITGPSNHAKSIFMINICKNILLKNQSEFQKGDVLVYITLEDDLNKVLRRFISIFGNVDSKLTKQLFVIASTLFKRVSDSPDKKNASLMVSQLLTEVINNSIIKYTSVGNCKIIIKHSPENSFSPEDATKFIDSLKLQGYNTRALFIDYIDVMKPTSTKYTNYNDYDAHGLIVHELRKIAQNYKLPTMSITQNTRGAENMMQAMSNNLIGDSYKKIRFSDYIYMIRMRSDLDILNPAVKNDVIDLDDDEQAPTLNMTDMSGQYAQTLVVFEVQITKAKEGKKDVGRFHIFSGLNLNIYNRLSDFYADLPLSIKNNKELSNQINILDMQQRQQFAVQNEVDLSISLI